MAAQSIEDQTLSRLKEHLQDDFTNLVKEYIFSAQNSIFEIERLIDDESKIDDLRIIVKNLETNSAYVGASELMKVCMDIDAFIKIQDKENIEYCFEQMENIFFKTRNDLSVAVIQ